MKNFFQKYGWISALIAVIFLVIVAIVISINRPSKVVSEKNNSSLTTNSKQTISQNNEQKTVQEDKKVISNHKDEETDLDNQEIKSNEIESDNKFAGVEKPNIVIKDNDLSLSDEENRQEPQESLTVSEKENGDKLKQELEEKEFDSNLTVDQKANAEEEKPVEEKAVEEKPVEEKPVEEKPVEEKPAEELFEGEILLEENVVEKENIENIEKIDSGTGNSAIEQSETENALEIDVMRVDETGEALIAGKAEPNTTVEVRANNKLIATTKSDDSGNFVAMGTIKEKNEAATLTVRSEKRLQGPNDVQLPGEASIESNETELTKTNEAEWILSEDVFVVLPAKLQQNKTDDRKVSNVVPLIVQTDSDDIKIVQYRDVSSVTEITIDSISYSDLGEAVLIGRAKPYYKVLVYLNNKLLGTSQVGASGGWTTELTGVTPGIYNLRLDEVDSEGVVQSRIETPFKKESPDILMNMVSGSITVQPGNSLWRIARRIFGRGIRYIEIYEKNSNLIKDPDLIYPGQVFAIPTENIK